jgi:ubiquitin thioesterase protein OTUB1
VTEYASDPVYRDKVEELRKTYAALRRMRPDGNCFFRAFSYAALEGLLGKVPEAQAFRAKVTASREKLTTAGFVQFTIDDFYDHFLSVSKKKVQAGFFTTKFNLFHVTGNYGKLPQTSILYYLI